MADKKKVNEEDLAWVLGNFQEEAPALQTQQQQQQQSTSYEDASNAAGLTARAAGLVARAGAEGIAGTIGMFTDPIYAAANLALPDQYKLPYPYEQVVSNYLTQLGAPTPEPGIESGASNIVKALAGTAGMTGTAKRIATAIEESARAAGQLVPTSARALQGLAANPSEQYGGAAGAAVGTELAKAMGMEAGGQLGTSLVGSILGAKMGAPSVPAKLPADVVQTEKMFGDMLPVTTSDIFPPTTPSGRSARNIAERTLFGIGGKESERQKNRVAIVRDYVADLGATNLSQLSDNVMSDLLSTRAATTKRWNRLKSGIINRLSVADQPVPPVVREVEDPRLAPFAGLGIRTTRTVTTPQPNAPRKVNTARTTDAVNRQIDAIRRANPNPDPETSAVLNRLESWRDNIQNKSLAELDEQRMLIGSQFSAPGIGTPISIPQQILNGIYDPIKKDMGSFIRQFGRRQDYNRWTKATEVLKEDIGELEVNALKAALNKGEQTPELINNLMLSKKPSDNALLARNLSNQGRQNAFKSLIAKAYEDSIPKASGVADQAEIPPKVADPSVFASNVEDLMPQIKAFATETEYKNIQNIVNAMNRTKIAGEMAKRTGSAVFLPQIAVGLSSALSGLAAGISGGLVQGITATAATAGLIGLSSKAYESKAFRDALVKFNASKPGSPAEQYAAQRLLNIMQANQASQPEQQQAIQ